MSGSPNKAGGQETSNVPDDHGAGGEEHQRLWRELAEVIAAADPVPPEVVQRGRDSFAWRTIDADLAALSYDSSAEPAAAAAVRGSEAPRQLTFEASALTVGVEVTVVGSRRRLIGQLVPPRQALVSVRHQHGGTVAVEADELGRFRADDLPAGLSSLRCQLSGLEEGTAVVTDWVVL
ncbi:MAG TPA: hypothetical protein VE664_07005 [Actinomycetes bacterium]|nr:hypothetical protein [Actinomycetes bacterium]